MYAAISICSLVWLFGCSGPSSDGGGTSASMIRIAQKARKSGNSEAAISFYNKALNIDPSSATAYFGLAEVYIDTNLLDGALEYVKKAEKLFMKSGSIDALNALGAIYDEREEHQKAQVMYKKVISMDPNYIDAYNNMGLSLLLSERYRDAIFYLENACSLPEANVTYRSNLALAYGLSGNIAKARAVYAQDFEGDDLEEKVAYVEDLLASKQKKSLK